jgi:hypothetical protein
MTSGYYIRISKEEYFEVPPKFRERATFFDNDFDKYSDDPQFVSLYKEYKKAKKELETRKYQLRHE